MMATTARDEMLNRVRAALKRTPDSAVAAIPATGPPGPPPPRGGGGAPKKPAIVL
jgi:hypothetical protein